MKRKSLRLQKLILNIRTARALATTQLAKNITSMYFVQAGRYLIPLITIPYLARVLGVSGWGGLAFIQAFSLYLCIVIDYGFELSATRDVAKNKDENDSIAATLANVLFAKVGLAVLVMSIAILIFYGLGGFSVSPMLYWMGVYWALANTFNLFWFFQGIERVQLIAALDFTAKIIGIVAIVHMVKGPDDDWVVLAIHGTTSSIVFLMSLYYAIRKVGFKTPTLRGAISTFRTGWDAFLIRLSSGVYASSSPFVFGLVVGPELVGPYSAAEKITRTVKELMRPITRTLYPRFSILLTGDIAVAHTHIRRTLLLLSTFSLALALVVYIFSKAIISLLFGSGYESAATILQWMSFSIVLSTICNILAIQWLLPMGRDKTVRRIHLITVTIFGLAATIFASTFGAIGMVGSILVAEMVMIFLCLRIMSQDAFSPQLVEECKIDRKG